MVMPRLAGVGVHREVDPVHDRGRATSAITANKGPISIAP